MKSSLLKWFVVIILVLVLLAWLSILKIVGISEKCYVVDTDIGHCDTIFSPAYWQEDHPDSWKEIHYLTI